MISKTVLQQDILLQLQKLNKREKAFRSLNETERNGHDIKARIAGKAKKYADSARAFTFIAGFCVAVTGIFCMAMLWGYRPITDPKSGWLFIFLTLCNIGSALLHRLRWQQLKQQLVLMDLLKTLGKAST